MADVWVALKPKIESFELAMREWMQLTSTGLPQVLHEAMCYSLFAGGKRLRPMLAGLACEAVGGEFDRATMAGIALEMIHTYSLVHDDLPAMDDDDLRRGRPTCHKVYGDALAILAGDGLQAMAFEVLAKSYPANLAAVMVMELVRGAGPAGMVGGQVNDLIEDGRIQSHRHGSDIERLENIHHLKTGALFQSSLALGALAANQSNDDQRQHLKEYGEAFGLLFQITDDLLDAEGCAKTTGKATGKDSARGKLTYPGLIGIAASREAAERYAQECVNVAKRFDDRGLRLGELAMSMVRRTH